MTFEHRHDLFTPARAKALGWVRAFGEARGQCSLGLPASHLRRTGLRSTWNFEKRAGHDLEKISAASR
jgi:hypothetical protein